METLQINYLLIVKACNSDNTIIWLSFLLIYIVIVATALVVLAFKSSAIRYKNFNDTKATNAFTFLTIFMEFLGASLLVFLPNS